MSNDRPTIGISATDYISPYASIQNGIGEFIAGDVPSSPVGAVVQDGLRKVCDSWSNGPTWGAILKQSSKAALSNACEPYLADNGSGSPSLQPPTPPFTGGQCQTTYKVDGFITQPNGTENFATQDYASGPVQTYSVAQTGQFQKTLTLVGANGVTTTRSLNWAVGGSARFSGPERLDGQADNCGNPPSGDPTFQPNPNPRPDPVLPTDDQPFEDPDGRPVIPMPRLPNPFGDPIQLPNIPLPDLFGRPPSDNEPPTGPGTPGSPSDSGADGNDEGEAPEGKVLIGIKVEIMAAPLYARKAQFIQQPPFIGSGYIYLGWPNQLELQPQGTFMQSGDFFVAPPNATKWRTRATIGYSLRTTPYYAPKPIQEI